MASEHFAAWNVLKSICGHVSAQYFWSRLPKPLMREACQVVIAHARSLEDVGEQQRVESCARWLLGESIHAMGQSLGWPLPRFFYEPQEAWRHECRW
jgi:hypothetical protein